MTDRRCGSWVAQLLVLGGIGALASQAHAAVRMPTHVACVGDSITQGNGATDAATKSYPPQLQGLFGSQVSVKNFGHSGATMLSKGFGDLPYQDQTEYQAATDFVKNAGANAVVDVVIMLGANDSKPYNWAPTGKPKNDQQYLTDYRAMVEHFMALTPKPEVFLALPLSTGNSPCCSISGTVIHDEQLPLIKQLAKEKSLPVIDVNTPTANHPEYFTDGVHPNDAGYVVVAKVIHDGLLQDLAALGGMGGMGGAGGSGGAAGSGGVAGAGGAAGSGGSSGSSTTGGTGGAGGSGGTGGASASAGSGGAALGMGGAGPATAGAQNAGGASVAGSPGSAGSAPLGGAGSAGSAATGGGQSADSSGCNVSGSSAGGPFSLLSLAALLALIGLRRRPVLHAAARS